MSGHTNEQPMSKTAYVFYDYRSNTGANKELS